MTYQQQTVQSSHVVRIKLNCLTIVDFGHLHVFESSLRVLNLGISEK